MSAVADPNTSTEARCGRRRAVLVLAGLVLTALGGIGAIAGIVITQDHAAPRPGLAPPATPTGSRPPDGWDTAAEDALAERPMLALPAQDAQPQPLSPATAGPAITLPTPAITTGTWIPGGLPDAAEGALAQLAALDQTALAGGDPQVYAQGYGQLSLPGAPNPELTGLATVLRSLRSHAGLADTGPVPGLTVRYTAMQGQIKGSTDGGRQTVVCVLGQLAVDYQGQSAAAGVGDCQALRWTTVGWRIAPGPLAAAAPSAWPGSAPAVQAGYRELS